MPQIRYDELWQLTKLSGIGLSALAVMQLFSQNKPLDRTQLLSVVFLLVPSAIFIAITMMSPIERGGVSPPQGRYAFPALASMTVLFVLGLNFFVELLSRLPVLLFNRKSTQQATRRDQLSLRQDKGGDKSPILLFSIRLPQLRKILDFGFLLIVVYMAYRLDHYALYKTIIPHYYGTISNLMDPSFKASLGSHPNLNISPIRQTLLATRPFLLDSPIFYPALFNIYSFLVGALTYAIYIGDRSRID